MTIPPLHFFVFSFFRRSTLAALAFGKNSGFAEVTSSRKTSNKFGFSLDFSLLCD